LDYGLLMSNFAKQLGGRMLTQQKLLCESLRRAILDGDIGRGSQLVPTRSLAEQLGIARNSVLYAYERLTEEGFVSTSRHGSVVCMVSRAALPPAAHVDSAGVPVSRLSRRVANLHVLRSRKGSHALQRLHVGVRRHRAGSRRCFSGEACADRAVAGLPTCLTARSSAIAP
jgi:GntR family transcriptional regulator / MocR family aminotransferase